MPKRIPLSILFVALLLVLSIIQFGFWISIAGFLALVILIKIAPYIWWMLKILLDFFAYIYTAPFRFLTTKSTDWDKWDKAYTGYNTPNNPLIKLARTTLTTPFDWKLLGSGFRAFFRSVKKYEGFFIFIVAFVALMIYLTYFYNPKI